MVYRWHVDSLMSGMDMDVVPLMEEGVGESVIDLFFVSFYFGLPCRDVDFSFLFFFSLFVLYSQLVAPRRVTATLRRIPPPPLPQCERWLVSIFVAFQR